MAFRFKKHYSVEEARELIPQLRLWIDELNQNRKQVEQLDQRLGQLLTSGCDAGGEMVNNWIESLAGRQKVLAYLRELDIQLKDVERGLIDFPAIIAGKEVFLCWEKDEDDIEFWHDLETGYAGRARLPEA
jgi:hypothetical protein